MLDGYVADAAAGFLVVARTAAERPGDPQVARVMNSTLLQLALLLNVRPHLAPTRA